MQCKNTRSNSVFVYYEQEIKNKHIYSCCYRNPSCRKLKSSKRSCWLVSDSEEKYRDGDIFFLLNKITFGMKLVSYQSTCALFVLMTVSNEFVFCSWFCFISHNFSNKIKSNRQPNFSSKTVQIGLTDPMLIWDISQISAKK